MLKILKHRGNAVNDIDSNLGIEIDVRDYNNELVLSHDYPNQQSVKLDE